MLKKTLFVALSICLLSQISAKSTDEPSLQLEPQTQEEALFVRRIIEFWDEKSYELVEAETLAFIDKFPGSALNDSLHALMGDLYVHKKDYGRALQAYSKIVSQNIEEKVLFSRLQCLHLTSRYEELTKIAEPYMKLHLESKKKSSVELVSLVADSYYQLATQTLDQALSFEYADHAKKYYEVLLRTDRSDEVLVPLAYLHNILQDYERAADLYHLAAKSNPADEENLLFKAARLEVKFDKESALDTFSRVARMKKSQASKAAFNRMVLLFETKQYADLVLAKDQLTAQIPTASKPMLHFFLGRSYYELEDYKRAYSLLSSFVDEEKDTTPERKLALLTLLECARIDENFPQFDENLSSLEIDYPNSREIPEAIFIRAMMNKEHSYLEDARRDFERLEKQYPAYENQDLFQYEFAKLLYDLEDYSIARQKYQAFIQKFPDHKLKGLAWHYFIQSSISHAKLDRSKDSFAKDQLAFDLESMLNEPGLLNTKEHQEYELLLAKTNYEIQAYEESIELLKHYLQQPNLPDHLLAEGHLILGYCYRKGMRNMPLFCEHAEKALSYQTKNIDLPKVHVELYNSYLCRSKKTPEHLEVAAEHLYTAQKKGADIKQANKIWLADFFFTKAKHLDAGQSHEQRLVYIDRSMELFEKAFKTHSVQLMILDDDTVCYVPYILKLASLYEMKGDFSKKREILAQLYSQHVLNSQLKWIMVDQMLFELAGEYAKIPEKKKEALSLYKQVLDEASSLQGYVAAASCLCHARLKYDSLSDKENRKSPDLQVVLSQLKDLSIQRVLENEPIHLEAAFDYIDVHCATIPSEKRLEKREELLINTVESFKNGQDVLTRDYQLKRGDFPEKDHIYSLYMDFFEAEILYCKSQLANKESRLEDEKYYEEEAKRLFLQLQNERELTEYLQNRIIERLTSL